MAVISPPIQSDVVPLTLNPTFAFGHFACDAAMFHEQFFELSHHQLNVAIGPSHGPPLILFHGVLRRWSDFAPILGPLAARWQIFAVDHRGHGASDRVAGRYVVTDYAEDAKEFIARYVSQPPVLYGHSLGGMVALATAARQQVRGVILEDPPFETMGAAIQSTSFHSLFTGMREAINAAPTDLSLADRLAEIRICSPGHTTTTRLGDVRDAASLRFSAHCVSQIDPDVLTPIVAGRWLDGYDLECLASQVSCPTLLLQSDMTVGGMLTDHSRELLEQRLSDCTSVRFPNQGHLLHWCATQQLLAPVLMFLESLR